MDPKNSEKTTFMTDMGNYYYKVMHFNLKNTDATYQWIMNKVFKNQVGEMLEVYMDHMIVKSAHEETHTSHLKIVFAEVRKYHICLNPEKCTFSVKSRKI
jgi:hypothetical protein